MREAPNAGARRKPSSVTPSRRFAALTAYGLFSRNAAATAPHPRLAAAGGSVLSFGRLPGLGAARLSPARPGQRHCRAGLSLGPAGRGLRSFRVRLPRMALEYAAGPGGAAALVAHRAVGLYRPIRQ